MSVTERRLSWDEASEAETVADARSAYADARAAAMDHLAACEAVQGAANDGMKRSDIPDRMVCEAYHEWSELKAEFVDAILCRLTGAPVKVVYAAMERAYDRDFVECGVTLRSGWLTDKGLALLGLERKPFDAAAAMVEIRDAWLQVAKRVG